MEKSSGSRNRRKQEGESKKMNMNKMLKQAQKLQQKMNDIQSSFNEKEFEVTAGGGAVRLVMTGSFEVKELSIDAEAISADDKEGLEDLIVSAFNQAISKVKENLEKEMGQVAGSMGLPPGLGF